MPTTDPSTENQRGTRDPLEQDLARAFELAFFLLRDRERSRSVALEALDLLEVAWWRQGRRRYYRPRGRWLGQRLQRRRNRVSTGREALLQRLVLHLSEHHERELERGTPHPDDLTVRYVAFLVRLGLRRNAFHTLVGVGRLLLYYRTADLLALDALITQDPDHLRGADYLRARKGVLRREIRERFGDFLEERRGPRGERRFAAAPPDRRTADLAWDCLERLVPWGTTCPLPERSPRELDPLLEPLPSLSFEGDEADEEHGIEMRRIHSVIHPRCLSWLAAALGLEEPGERLQAPLFRIRIDDPPPTRQPPAPSPEELAAWAAECRQRRGDRRRAAPGQLFVRVDGGPPMPWEPGQPLEIFLSEGTERIDLLRRPPGEPPVVLGLLLLGPETTGCLEGELADGSRVTWRLAAEGAQRRLTASLRSRRRGFEASWKRFTGRPLGWAMAVLTLALVGGLLLWPGRIAESPPVRAPVELRTVRIDCAPSFAEGRALARRLEARLRAEGRLRVALSGPTDLRVEIFPAGSDQVVVRVLQGDRARWRGVYRTPTEEALAIDELAAVIGALADGGEPPSPRTTKPAQ